MKNRSHIVTLMAMLAFVFVTLAAIAPAALAGRSEVYFSDVNGTPKTEWGVGEVLYVTVVSHDENRESDEAEIIDARSVCETHTGVKVPCVEVWDPNTKDSETNQGSLAARLVLVETGIDTGIFRSQTGILILPVEADPDYQENGSLEVFQGDTIAVRYQSPSDDNDIDLDLAKISSTAGTVHITNQASQEKPVWQVGEQIWVTVEDPDLNIDPLKPDTIKNVTLWNTRCVWDALERLGNPRPDQPQPKPCGAPVAFDDRLNAQDSSKFAKSLTLVETGPNTGVFRNVNGITLIDNLGPDRQFPNVTTAMQLFVNHKDTIVAFYRKATLVGAAAAPPPPPPPPPLTRTDTCPASPLFECSRTVPLQVAPGGIAEIKVVIKAKQDMRLIALREQAPAGFSFGRTQATPTPKAISTDGALRAAWDGDIKAGDTITLTYELIAGATPGTFKIRGFFTGAPFTIVPLVSDLLVSASAGQSLGAAFVSAQVAHTGENAQLRIARDLDTYTANAGENVTIKLTVTSKQALPAVSVKENFDGLTLVDQGADFIGVEGTTLRGLMIQPAAGATQTFTYTVKCQTASRFTVTGTAESRNVATVTAVSTVDCTGGGPPPPPPPPTVTGFHRGQGAPNDPQDFALAVAKVGHLNPASIQFTDLDGNEISEFSIGQEFFITMIDDDQNMDSDHVETLCVQVFDVNGGREGDTPGVSVDPDSANACKEDHVRDLFMWKNGVKLVETGTNTGIFRNPDTLKIIGICEYPENDPAAEPFNTKPADTKNNQIHKLNWWQGMKAETVLKDCYPSTPYKNEGRLEFKHDPAAAVQDVAGHIAVHAGDVVYVVYQDQLVDPFDNIYASARVMDYQSINHIQFVDENGSPAETYKVGQDVFIKMTDLNRNVNSNTVDKLDILVLDRNSGDWENITLEETGADTGEFMNREGLSLQPATSPDAIRINNDRLEMFDRDVIEAHYQDNYNPKDYSAAWIRLIPQPMPGPIPPTPGKVEVKFTDAQGRAVTDYGVGDTVYVKVTDHNQDGAGTLAGAVVVKNTRTGDTYRVDLTETSELGVFLSDAITTGAPGSVVDLEVEEGDTLEATYNTVTATVDIVSRAFSCTGARFTAANAFMAVGSGISRIAVGVYDLSGKLVAQLQGSGAQVTWDGRTTSGESLAKGVYLYQLTCSGRMGETATVAVQKLLLR